MSGEYQAKHIVAWVWGVIGPDGDWYLRPMSKNDAIAFAAMKNGEVPEKYAALVEAAYGLAQGCDWNKGNHAIMHGFRAKLILAIDAIRPLADRYVVQSALAAVEGKR
jgi:hypothetical protein